MEAVRLYVEAESLETNDNDCKLVCWRELVQLYRQLGSSSSLKQIQLYFFDCELEAISKILYLAECTSTEGQSIVAQGPSLFSRLNIILRDESSEVKALVFEQMYTKMN